MLLESVFRTKNKKFLFLFEQRLRLASPSRENFQALNYSMLSFLTFKKQHLWTLLVVKLAFKLISGL